MGGADHGLDNEECILDVDTSDCWAAVEQLIRDHLTARQRQIVELHFFRGFDQPQVAEILGISQQAVSEHLFGKRCGEGRIGGILPKLRKLCVRVGIKPPRRRQ
jgi:hypothetical protein